MKSSKILHLLSLRELTKVLLWLCIFLTMLFSCKEMYCKNIPLKTLRVAVLDNPNLPEKISLWVHYENAYLVGIEMAKFAAEKQNIRLVYKTFFYGNKPLAVLKQISKVKAWKPDVILGPHYSNQFLLLEKYFPDTLVLSSYASDPEIAELPANFYSIFPPDNTLIKALSKFINNKFPNKDIFMITQADCKNCNDMAKLLVSDFKKINSKIHISETSFVDSKIEAIDIARITEGYKKGDIIFLEPETYYRYINLMPRIVDHLKASNMIFFTALDSWGDSDINQKFVGPIPHENYTGYRITSLLLEDTSSIQLQKFKNLYINHYKKLPKDPVSYMTFLSIMSAVTALKDFPEKNENLSMKEQVLLSFKKAVTYDSNWFRPKQYGIYQYNNHSAKKEEILIKKIPAFEP